MPIHSEGTGEHGAFIGGNNETSVLKAFARVDGGDRRRRSIRKASVDIEGPDGQVADYKIS